MAEVRKSFKSPKGTELPIMNLKGKEYLAVANRLVLFREANPTGIIKTTMLSLQGEGPEEYCVFKSEIYVDTERGPMCIASGHKRESRKDFPDFIEKCETSATGRALTLAGYGLQFVGDELDEGNRLADAPLPVLDKPTNAQVIEAFTNGGISAVAESLKAEVPTKRSSFRRNTTVATPSEDI